MYKTSFMYLILMNYIFLGIYFLEVCCAPTTDGQEEEVLEQTPLIESEIVFGSDVIPLKDLTTSVERNLVADPRRLWPNRTLLYELQDEVPAPLRARVLTALDHLSRLTCVRFLPRRRHLPYLRVRLSGKGCFSKVGYPQRGGSPSLQVGSSRCWTPGTIQHEFLHALGFWHEHARPDRDQFISVLWDNIQPDHKKDFIKRSSDDATSLGLPYDFASVMHYKPTAFGKPKGSPTLVSKKKEGTKFMGQRRGVTKVDIAKLNRLYNCQGEYYRGDDLEGVKEVVGEVLEPLVQDIKDEEEKAGRRKRPEKKERRGKILKKGDKAIKENSNLIKYLMYNEFSRSTGLTYVNEILEKINATEDVKHNRVRRGMDEPKSREGKKMSEGEQQISANQEQFAPQKILPELLKGVLNNDNNDRPIVIQFAIYQPIVYKSANESENEDENKSKQASKDDTTQKPINKNEKIYESNNRNIEIEKENKGNVESRRPVVDEPHVERQNAKPPPRYETRDEYYSQDKTYNRPSPAASGHNEPFSGFSKDIQPLNVYKKGEEERIKDRPDQYDYDVRVERFGGHREEYKDHVSNERLVTEETIVETKHSTDIVDHFEEPKEYHPTYKPYTHEIGIEDTLTDKREYLRIPTSQHEDDHYDQTDVSNHKTTSISVDDRLHSDFSGLSKSYFEDSKPSRKNKDSTFSSTIVDEEHHSDFPEGHALPSSNFKESKSSRKNNDNNFKVENVSPFWNSGMSEDDNIKQFKTPEVDEDPLKLSGHGNDHTNWKANNRDGDVIERRVVEHTRSKTRHDLEIKDAQVEELDIDIRRRKLEQDRLKEITTRRPVKPAIPEMTTDKLSTRVRDSDIDRKNTQNNSAKVPKRSQPDSAEDRKDDLEGLISKPNAAKLNLSPDQALPLNASVLRSSPSTRTVIRKFATSRE